MRVLLKAFKVFGWVGWAITLFEFKKESDRIKKDRDFLNKVRENEGQTL